MKGAYTGADREKPGLLEEAHGGDASVAVYPYATMQLSESNAANN